jgi:hypothetical protein
MTALSISWFSRIVRGFGMKSINFIKHYVDPRSTFSGLITFCAMFSCALYFSFVRLLKIPLNDEIFWSASLGVTGFILIKFVEVRTKRYNALCHLEVELGQAFDALGNMINTLRNMIQQSIPMLLPHDMPFLTLDLVKIVGRLDVKNNLRVLLCDFRVINQDWSNLIDYGKEHAETINDPAHPQHAYARRFGTELLESILSRAEFSQKLVQETIVLVRVYVKEDKPFLGFKQPYISSQRLNARVIEEERKVALEREENH